MTVSKWTVAVTVATLVSGWPIVASAQSGAASPPAEPATTQLEDIVVSGDRIERLASRFVDEVAAPVEGRGLARWMAPVCVGVVNFAPDAAHQIADRIAVVAGNLGVPIKDGPCTPNIFIIGTSDGPGLAQRWVSERRADFSFGAHATHASSRALQDFRTSDDPVRWWHVSVPMYYDVVTGNAGRAVRFPGGPPPQLVVFSRSQMRARVRDDLFRVAVIVDVNRLDGVTTEQLCDYLVMVSFSQTDPRADTAPYDTILNLFKQPGRVAGLTDWDRSYLASLYAAPADQRRNGGVQAAALATEVRQTGSVTPP